METPVNGNNQSGKDQYWQLKKAIIKSIAAEPTPSVRRMNQEFLEEFGYLPDFKAFAFLVESIKDRRRETVGKEEADPKFLFTDKVANSSSPTVPGYFEQYRSQFGELPGNNVLKYFLAMVQARKDEAVRKKDPGFALAEEIACCDNPTFSSLCRSFQSHFEKAPSFEIIDYFINKILRGTVA